MHSTCLKLNLPAGTVAVAVLLFFVCFFGALTSPSQATLLNLKGKLAAAQQQSGNEISNEFEAETLYGIVCIKQSVTRQLVALQSTCNAGDNNVGGICWKPCNSGDTLILGVCWHGLSTYPQPSYAATWGCPSGFEEQAGACYAPCPPGYPNGVGAVCYQSCPQGYPIDSGAYCAQGEFTIIPSEICPLN